MEILAVLILEAYCHIKLKACYEFVCHLDSNFDIFIYLYD